MQYKLTPLQAIRSFIFPPHFLHFMSLVYPERVLNENKIRSNTMPCPFLALKVKNSSEKKDTPYLFEVSTH
jgi:hypothetical protein